MIYVTIDGPEVVSVISEQTNTVVAIIGVGHAPIGVAVNPRTATIYVANEASNSVSVINPATGAIYVTNAFRNTLSVLAG